jgi:hypothetical protein
VQNRVADVSSAAADRPHDDAGAGENAECCRGRKRDRHLAEPGREGTAGDLVGRTFVSIVAPEHKAVAQRQLERLLLGLPVADYAIDLFTVDGRRRRDEISSVMVEGGEPY